MWTDFLVIEEIKTTYSPKANRPKITGSGDTYTTLKPAFENCLEYFESFKIMLLNNSNEVLGFCTISEGGITGTIVDVRMIFQKALIANATSIILAHNHPSGGLKPSQADITITEKIKKAGNVLDINILDHIILTKFTYYSFADEGIL